MSKVRGHVNVTNTLSGTLEVQQTQLVPSCLQLGAPVLASVCTRVLLRALWLTVQVPHHQPLRTDR